MIVSSRRLRVVHDGRSSRVESTRMSALIYAGGSGAHRPRSMTEAPYDTIARRYARRLRRTPDSRRSEPSAAASVCKSAQEGLLRAVDRSRRG